MKVKRILLSALEVNPANDRHGELQDEAAAIRWLFRERELHMRNLARDILANGEVFEMPLVTPFGEKYRVFDGNRRVTCLKVLQNPSLAPSDEIAWFFSGLRSKWNGKFPSAVECQVESNEDRINAILFRRHTGSQKGIGQSTWDDRMKRNFIARTGKTGTKSIADEIEARLMLAELLPVGQKVPRSTLNRLFSSEAFRNRVNISMEKGEFRFLASEDETLLTLSRISSDLSSRNVVLGDLWDAKRKHAYLDSISAPIPTPSLETSPQVKEEKPIPTSKLNPTARLNLIPQKKFQIEWLSHLQKHHVIWEELQFHLLLSKHINAISVLFRVLLEISVENYIQVKSVNVHKDDKLALKVEKVGKHMVGAQLIDSKTMEVLSKFKHGDKIVSADTMNKYVHSPNFAPSPQHLTAMWDSLADFIVICLKA